MLVKDILAKIGIISGDTRIVKGICFDSKNVKDGDIFVAYKGNLHDGNDYIHQAFENGAVCVVSDRLVGYDIYKSNNIEKDKISLIKALYKTNKVKLIGITGTNGKTSTAHLLYQAFNNMGIRATYIGTLGVIDRDYRKELENTTPNMDVLAKEIVKALDRGCKYVIMEVSSHSLSMNRIKPFNFDIIAFTNLSQDHLDYYKNMEDYFLAKKILFDNANKKCIGIVNNEDKYSKRIIEDFKGKVVTYGKNSDYDYKIISNNLKGIKFRVQNTTLVSPLIYKLNVYNLLLVYTILDQLNINHLEIKKAMKSCKCIEGRMEVLHSEEFTIILDYAHTPDALERILKETNKIKKGNCIVLFGCGGNRDKSKRSIMGKIASDNADIVYLTNDNPRNEDEKLIVDDILKGICNRNNIVVELDRKKAIENAISQLKKDDILLILGKGHETYQIFKNQKIYFSDRDIVNTCLEK